MLFYLVCNASKLKRFHDQIWPIWAKLYKKKIIILYNVVMQSLWHLYIKKTLLENFVLSKQSMEFYLNFQPGVGNPINVVKYKAKSVKFHILSTQLFCFGHTSWLWVMGSGWKNHVLNPDSKKWRFHHDPMTFTNLSILLWKPAQFGGTKPLDWYWLITLKKWLLSHALGKSWQRNYIISL